MKTILLLLMFICLATTGLHAQRRGGDIDYQRYNDQKTGRTTNTSRRGGYNDDTQEKDYLDGRKASDKLQMTRPVYRGIIHPKIGDEETTIPQQDAENSQNKLQTTETEEKPKIKLPKDPVSGPGNPLAPPLTCEYMPMPKGDKVIECRYCHYIYYSYFMPERTPCELKGHNHFWQVIGKTGHTWYRCINCNTYVCCAGSPLRSYCGHDKTHVWELVP